MAQSRLDELLEEIRERRRLCPTSVNLRSSEIFWRDHQVWLQEMGYMLRPRYHPDWVASARDSPHDLLSLREDTIWPLVSRVLDATKISTNETVMIKKISKADHPYETEIHKFLSEEPLASHPRNHCARLIEVLQPLDDPDITLLVMPLYRSFNSPMFQTVGEVVECLGQFFEGIQFMHQCHVAHRDCNAMNLMMDPKELYPDSFHPQRPVMNIAFTRSAKHYNRTKAPVRHILIDFGISRKFDPEGGPPREFPIRGGDKSAPEIATCTGLIDPFPTDVYYLGNMIREDILKVTRGAEFLVPLMTEMVQEDPLKRPTMDTVVQKFDDLRRSLYWWQLRARLRYVEEDEWFGLGPWRNTKHFFRTAGHLLKSRSALPVPK